jgi:dTMP kinase
LIPARFISIEGGEGSGKSTQARLLAEWLENRGTPVVLTREPGGTAGAEAVRQLLLHPPSDEQWFSEAEALLFAAARSDHVARVIRPALSSGKWVISDRFLDSSLAYQGAAGALGVDVVRSLHRVGSGGLLPDRTILLQVSPEKAAQRVRLRDAGKADAIGGRSSEYHAQVAAAFASLAKAEPSRFITLNADADVDRVHHSITAEINACLFGPAA